MNQSQIKIPALTMYVDENGHYDLHADLADLSNRFLCLTGVVMSLDTHHKLESRLNIIKTKYFDSTEVILHRREIISAYPPFEILSNNKIRNDFDNDILNVISSLEYSVIAVLIDKMALVDKFSIIKAQDPYALALEYLMQRFQYSIQDYNRKNSHQIYGDILAESRGGKEDRITKETYKLIYQSKGYNLLHNAQYSFSSSEIKLKKKNTNIAGLQFVDLVSHPARRYILTQNNLGSDLKKTSFEQKIVDILVLEKFRRNSHGIIEGHGTVFFPKKTAR